MSKTRDLKDLKRDHQADIDTAKELILDITSSENKGKVLTALKELERSCKLQIIRDIKSNIDSISVAIKLKHGI